MHDEKTPKWCFKFGLTELLGKKPPNIRIPNNTRAESFLLTKVT